MSLALPIRYHVKRITQDPRYYLTGGDTFFIVSNFIFKVHRYFFERESHHFRELLAKADNPLDPSVPSGRSIAQGIRLQEIDASDFRLFLSIFYNPRYSIYDYPRHNWHAIRQYALMWDFPEVTALCDRQLAMSVDDEEHDTDENQPEDLISPSASPSPEPVLPSGHRHDSDPNAEAAIRRHLEDDHGC